MAMSWGDLAPYDRLVNTSIVEPRAYQISIIRSTYSGKNTLVILPTGLGKTIIAVFAIAKALQEGKKALIVAPTKPLSEQHLQSLERTLNVDKSSMLLLTGSISKSKRGEAVAAAKVITATPQTVANDMKNGRIKLEDYGVVVFDECHRAVGRYAYIYIADECKIRGVQMLGLTASPGSDRKKISALIETLGIENIEVRISTDPDVEQYVMKKDTEVIAVDKTPTMNAILNLLKPVIARHLNSLYTHGLSPFKDFETLPKGRLLQIGDAIKRIQAANYKFMGIFDYVYVLTLCPCLRPPQQRGHLPVCQLYGGAGKQGGEEQGPQEHTRQRVSYRRHKARQGGVGEGRGAPEGGPGGQPAEEGAPWPARHHIHPVQVHRKDDYKDTHHQRHSGEGVRRKRRRCYPGAAAGHNRRLPG